ncbi:competence/damage-inducible protein A [Exiguobacterium antarcticum]|uniref:Putative competence-damage inducible protein n=1 Tax=Exiguobacterium antarcticum TaxID=132920 RepID=A0ABT6R1D7_9BACL|nr:competence/damage-inducible protein A [Exiguobacterium antarcticum]MDI3234751.1 competence/damage-inducible protein A [Exiguobacterium antarcticum]
MKAEIIAVGSELLLGEIANTNAQYLSEWLATCGIDVYYHTVVGDNRERMTDVIRRAQGRVDLLVITGGLGPTEDDLTKEVVAELLERSLQIDQPAYDRIEAFLKTRGRTMTNNEKKQALIIEGADVLTNNAGLAPGMSVHTSDHQYILLPGVPREMKRIIADHFDHLLGKETIKSRTLRFFGIGESALNDRLADLIRTARNPSVAPYAELAEVRLRLTAKALDEQTALEMLDRLERQIRDEVGTYFYGYGETSLPEVVLDDCRKAGLTLSAAESLTGGAFASGLTDIKGASDVFRGSAVVYSDVAKINVLGVAQTLLDQQTAVSREVAIAMAEGARALYQTDLAIALTGEAGPTSNSGQTVGTVYCALAQASGTEVLELTYPAFDRGMIRLRSVKDAYFMLIKNINHSDKRIQK